MSSDFFTKDEIAKFTLPNEEEYRDIDNLNATIVMDSTEPAKKKRNNMQRNSSAYALFFRDSQSIIRAQNKNASFGQISKIIANEWKLLPEQFKLEYKRRVQLERKHKLMQKAFVKANSILGSSSNGNNKIQ